MSIALRIDNPGYLLPLSEGVRVIDGDEGLHDETRLAWAVYTLADVEAWIGPVAKRDPERLAYEITGWHAEHGSPGSWFWGRPFARVIGTRVIVYQHGAFDV